MKVISNLFLSVFFVGISSVSLADDEQSCTAILCLSGGLAHATGFKECAPSLQAFGNIKIYSQRGFEGELTRVARAVFLERCTSADKNYVRQALMVYGDREYIDVNL